MNKKSIRIEYDETGISPDDLKGRGLIGKIMWHILLCDRKCCRDKESYLELLEETAKQIIQEIKTEWLEHKDRLKSNNFWKTKNK